MDNVQVTNFLKGSDALIWKEAIELYNGSLKKGESSRKYINLDIPGSDGQSKGVNAHELMVTAINSYQKLYKKSGPFATALMQIHHTLHRYSKAIDIFVQCDPAIAGLVWGSVRVLLQVAEEGQRASRIASEGIIEILRHVGRWEQVSAISDLLGSQSIHKALVDLYVNILDFLVSSTQWLKRCSLRRLGGALFELKADKFSDKLNEMRRAATLVDQEVQTRGLNSLQDISFDVRITMDKINQAVEQVEYFSEQTTQLQLSGQLARTEENTAIIKDVVADLKALPCSIVNRVLEQMKGATDVTRIKQWLLLSASGTSPPVPPADGTCCWLLKNPSFLKWVASNDDDSVLWVQGSGKSVMAGYLREHLEAKDVRTLFYQFQRTASTTQSTPTTLASSLIFQLLGYLRDLPSIAPFERLQQLATQFPLGPQHCSFDMIWTVMSSILSVIGFEFSLIIDAMDECLFDGRSLPGISTFFNTLYETFRGTRRKMVIFSRPEPSFASAAKPSLSIIMEKDILLPDVMTFACRQYEMLALPSQEKQAVLQRIWLSSHGSFRWVEMFLDDLKRSFQISDFKARLSTFPSSVSELYKRALLDSARLLDEKEVECRNALLLINFQAQRALKTTEVAEVLSLQPDRADQVIFNLCRPLVSTEGGFFHLSHPSVREFFELLAHTDDCTLGIAFSESHGLLAEKCLSFLLDEKYGNSIGMGRYLKENLGVQHADPTTQPRDTSFYNYASTFWDHHLTHTASPSRDLLRLTNEFLLSSQFVYWAEYSRRECGQFVQVLRALTNLKSWHKRLSNDEKTLVEIDKYFEKPYNQLSNSFNSNGDDKILPWLVLMSLGDFYYDRVNPSKAARVREHVLGGLQGLLGQEDILLHRARTKVAVTRLYAGKMRAAHRSYSDLANIQRKAFGESSLCFLETLIYKGQSEYYTTDFSAAVLTWTKASAEFLGLMGPDSWQYLGVQMWYARGISQLNRLDASLQILRSVFKKRQEQFGREDSFGHVVQVNIGEVLLMLGRNEESIANFQAALKSRREAYTLSDIFRVDVEIALAAAYQRAGKSEAAMAILKDIKEHGNLSAQFERRCQVAHIHGLILARDGFIDQAIDLLQDMLIQAENDQNNRTLLWVRLDVAAMLRRRGCKGDENQALMNFDNIVKDVSGDYEPGFPDEPDPPRLLAVAERALELIRRRQYAEARQELDANQVDWLRSSDFWLWVGGTSMFL
ncbi:hypothetical protein AAE478_005683 [Parahypoxylon ruwenzoriense]